MVVSPEDGMFDVSMFRRIGEAGLSSGRDDDDGEGDSTTDGIRLCLPLLFAPSPSNPTLSVRSGSFSFAGDISPGDSVAAGDGTFFDGVGAGADARGVSDQDHSKPGLSIKFIVSPLFTGYSFRSLPSTSAFPRSNKRCASAGGARGCEASCVLIEAIVSVVDTGTENEYVGFATLKVKVIEST